MGTSEGFAEGERKRKREKKQLEPKMKRDFYEKFVAWMEHTMDATHHT